MALGIQIHSVDNNAAVPWEWHEYNNKGIPYDTKIGAGKVLYYGEKGLTDSNQGTLDVLMYLTLFRQVVPANSIDKVALAPIRDDMVLEGYVLDSEEMPVMLGDKCEITGQQNDEGFDERYFLPSKGLGGSQGRFECVGIITDCEPVQVTIGAAKGTLTKKVLVRLIK